MGLWEGTLREPPNYLLIFRPDYRYNPDTPGSNFLERTVSSVPNTEPEKQDFYNETSI